MTFEVNENMPSGDVGHWLASMILCKNLGDSSDADLVTHLVVVVSKIVALTELTWQLSIGGEELLWRADWWKANGGLPRRGSWQDKKTRVITQ
ncbi:hypothetical protein Syun_012643 [Stephania yunnanensis]|uniref:Uncharacterized protein n=1 Tax=Stephania yunnanensis TaxID=152371 RepID=A0AAP0PFJ4_9MAGN